MNWLNFLFGFSKRKENSALDSELIGGLSIKQLTLSNLVAQEALLKILVDKGVISKEGFLEEVKNLRKNLEQGSYQKTTVEEDQSSKEK